MVKKKTCIFISGNGSNLHNLILHSRNYNFPIKICLIVSDNKDAYGINYAKKYKIPFIFINPKNKNHENVILSNLKKFKISFICLAGYMKIISKKLINKYPNRIINIHPSLLPKFKGLNTFARMLKNSEKNFGCTVHIVNEKIDSGNIIVQKMFYINTRDNEKVLKIKTQKLEYKAFPEAIVKIFSNISF